MVPSKANNQYKKVTTRNVCNLLRDSKIDR